MSGLNLTPLHLAAASGRLAVVKAISRLPGVDINSRSEEGNTSLHMAAYNAHPSVVKFLLTLPNVDAHCTNNDGETPLQVVRRGYAGSAAVRKALEGTMK